MTRKIKFRAWDKETKEMSYDFLNKNWLLVCIKSPYVELMQFTGLKDKNGKEIYEGDCLYAKGNLGGEDYIGYVSYCESEAKFVVCQSLHDRMEWIPNNECWVKGHIYEGNTQ